MVTWILDEYGRRPIASARPAKPPPMMARFMGVDGGGAQIGLPSVSISPTIVRFDTSGNKQLNIKLDEIRDEEKYLRPS